MSVLSSLPRALLLALAVTGASACSDGADVTDSVLGGGGGSSGGAGIVSGTLLGVGGPPPPVTIKVFLDNKTLLSAFTTTSKASGRFRITGLPAGIYRLEFTPPTPDPNDPSTELRTQQVGSIDVTRGEVVLPPILFAPVLSGGLLIRDNDAVNVQTLQFRTDPFDTGSPVIPGLESMFLVVRVSTQIRLLGFTLASLGIDDNTGTSTRELLVEIAVIPPDLIPLAHVDADGNSRTSQVYYQLYPSGFDFVEAALNPRELEIDYPNVNGLSSVYETPLISYAPITGTWEPAGVGDVNGAGTAMEQDSFDGVRQSGIVVGPGPPPPTTVVVGTVRNGGLPLAREGITVITNSGFRAQTDATGAYRIEDVPIPLNRADLVATAYTDAGLVSASASASARPIYPETTIDIELPATVLVAPSCDLASSEPAAGATGVRTNARMRLRFDAEMDRTSLQDAISVVATPAATGATETVSGTVITADFLPGGGAVHTDAFFLPDAPLPENATVVVSVSTAATNADGTALGAACTLVYQTGTSTLLEPRIDVVDPPRGTVGSTVRLWGINMDLASLTFDGNGTSALSKSQPFFEFLVPNSEGTEAPGPRTVQVDPGGNTSTFTILPRIDSIQIDTDPDPMVETLADVGAGTPGTAVAGVDQNDGTVVVINGQNLFDAGSGLMPVVTFGRGDGDPTGATDGDAAIDGPDETAAEQRVDVNVPPLATAGSVTVTVDDGTGTTFTSPPATFVTELPFDTTAPTLNMGTLDPMPGASNVLTSQIIRVEYDEAISGDSVLLVGAGFPVRKIPGTTRVTTSLDGSVGILEFLPEAGALPVSTTIQVQVSNTTVFDLAGNPGSGFVYTFATGTVEPSGDPPATRSDFGPPVVVGPSEDSGSPLPDSGVATDPISERAAGTASVEDEEPVVVAPPTPLARGLVLDEPKAWDALPRSAFWVDRAEAPRGWAVRLAEAVELDERGRASVLTHVGLDTYGRVPTTEDVLTLRLESELGTVAANVLVWDGDRDGRLELDVRSATHPELRVSAREDLVEVRQGRIDLRLPPRRAFALDGERLFLVVESLDADGRVARSPRLLVELR